MGVIMTENYIEVTICPESLEHAERVFKYDLNSQEREQARQIISGKRIIDNKHYVKDCTLSKKLFQGFIN